MKKVLSQEEIDAILHSIPVNSQDPQDQMFAVGNKSIKSYDFSHPDRLSHQRRKILEHIHENFAKELGLFLTDKLRIEISAHFAIIDQMTLTEFIQLLKTPNCLYIFELENYSGKGMFEIQPALVYFIVDRILGGRGSLLEVERELTHIEQRIMTKLIKQILEHFRTSWQGSADIQPVYRSYCSNPNSLRIAESSESIVSIWLEVNFANNVGLFHVAYPCSLIEKLIPTLETGIVSKKGKISEHTIQCVQRNLESITVPVAVKLGEAKINFEELINLQTGDVVCLQKHIDEDLELLIGGKPKFLGRAGMQKEHIAFKISTSINQVSRGEKI